MAVACLAASMLLAGHALSEWLWRREARHGRGGVLTFERATSSALVGLTLWIATNWLLSAIHAVARGPLLLAAAVAATSGAIVLRRIGGAPGTPAVEDAPRSSRALVMVALLPLLAWVAFILWRGWLLPVLNWDAMSYHLPKAVLMARAG